MRLCVSKEGISKLRELNQEATKAKSLRKRPVKSSVKLKQLNKELLDREELNINHPHYDPLEVDRLEKMQMNHIQVQKRKLSLLRKGIVKTEPNETSPSHGNRQK